MTTTPQFEIPTDMRKMTEQSLAQVRTAIINQSISKCTFKRHI